MSHTANDILHDELMDYFNEDELSDLQEFDLETIFKILMDRKN